MHQVERGCHKKGKVHDLNTTTATKGHVLSMYIIKLLCKCRLAIGKKLPLLPTFTVLAESPV